MKHLVDLLTLLRADPWMIPWVALILGCALLSCSYTNLLDLPTDVCNAAESLGYVCMAVGVVLLGVRHQLAPQQGKLEDISSAVDTIRADGNERLSTIETEVARVDMRQLRLMDIIMVPYYETDASGRTTYVNQAYADLLKSDRRVLLAEQPTVHFHPRELARALQQKESAIERQAAYKITARLVKSGRVTYKVTFHGHPHFEGGEFVGHHGTVQVVRQFVDEPLGHDDLDG